jgi:hypothetical protein
MPDSRRDVFDDSRALLPGRRSATANFAFINILDFRVGLRASCSSEQFEGIASASVEVDGLGYS